MNHDLRFTAEKLRKRLALVRAHRFRRRAVLPPFRRELGGAAVRGSLGA